MYSNNRKIIEFIEWVKSEGKYEDLERFSKKACEVQRKYCSEGYKMMYKNEWSNWNICVGLMQNGVSYPKIEDIINECD